MGKTAIDTLLSMAMLETVEMQMLSLNLSLIEYIIIIIQMELSAILNILFLESLRLYQ
jgi:hypothetical protein